MTYTIAMFDDMLLAAAPDGDVATMAARLADTLSHFDALDPTDANARLRIISGLTLFESIDDAKDAGCDVIFSDDDCGSLQDAEGRMKYKAAAKRAAGMDAL